jgi:hypothetical protein
MKKKVIAIQENSRMIDEIADSLLEDHIELLNENASLKKLVSDLRGSLQEIMDEYHPKEHWTDEHIEYENKQGNMMAPVVRRAMDAIAKAESA